MQCEQRQNADRCMHCLLRTKVDVVKILVKSLREDALGAFTIISIVWESLRLPPRISTRFIRGCFVSVLGECDWISNA